jgi:hypothetical protein
VDVKWWDVLLCALSTARLASVRCHESYETISYDLTSATQLLGSGNQGPFLNPPTSQNRRMAFASRSGASTGEEEREPERERRPGCLCTHMYQFVG